MGKSESIEEKIKKDEEFRVFMKGLETEGKAKEASILAQIDKTIVRHYEKNKWDYARLFGDAKSEYQNYNEWSLARIQGIINAIGNALRGADFPSPEVPGSEDAEESTIDDAKDNLGAFNGDYTLIIARVQALIAGVLTQFASSSSASQKTTMKDLPLSGGMHLFFGSSGEVFTSNDFFKNEFIGSFQIVFEVYMSVSEAKAIALKEILQTTATEITTLNAMIVDIRAKQQKTLKEILNDEKKKEADYKSTAKAFNEMRAEVAAERDKVVKEYDKYKNITDTVDQFFSDLNLEEFGKLDSAGNKIFVNDLFKGWELEVAKRYVREELVRLEAE